ncbi:hypothetical protein P175DRAFT_0469193 [Aspergillus ochraceoroseus IBT 24754]|uniref:Uncharacterized protein n=1 Tax=Aspergillus ochraceoroseus IBT 24754 TaxID=1392256 RepID=A0A2T5MAY6_9EURO|nr:uncharacterized protein P175DRAFT_0469193 [Aspergillus ochraceoroseus IBT 24754]PTU25680.1 hypothetical protein P175DRAFT_0469193 [Aspergillus ochraceoroseus IBT 24754]
MEAGPLTPETFSPEGSTISCPGWATPVQVSQNAIRPLTFPNIRLINIAAYADLPSLKAKVSLMTKIETSDEEILVRSTHPSLKGCHEVSVVEGGPVDRPVWLVNASDAHCIESTHAAGREIHIFPTHFSEPLSYSHVPVRDVSVVTIDPRAFLSPQVITLIREAFPGSSGIQIILTGWILVLFPDKKSVEACWAKGAPNNVGTLRVGYILTSCCATANVIESGQAVSDAPANIARHAALGLRLRLPGGLEAITTVTHAFVRVANPGMSNLRKGFMEWILSAKQYLGRLRPPPKQTQHAGIVHSKGLSNSPVGKEVWLSGTNTQIGTITVTYDRCSRHHLIPYPYGFQHDLSLVTGPNLPQLTSPPGTPRVTEWGPYEEALQGRPVFLQRYNIATGRFHIYQGHGITAQTQQAIIHGTQYSWEERSRGFNTALLWRTIRDTDSVKGASDSVLCLGKPHHETARALLFQNFEGSLTASEHIQIADNGDAPTFKGGFLLPEQIRQSQIITVENPFSKVFRTPQRSSNLEAVTQESSMTV